MENPKPVKIFTPGWVGRLVQTVIVLVTTNWVVVLSVILAYLSWLISQAQSFVKNEDVQTVALVFLFFLWTLIGLTVLRDRRKPREVTPHQDYRYGLTFEGVVPFYLPESAGGDGSLGFGVQLRNWSSGPLRYEVQIFEVILNDRILPRVKKGLLKSTMARGAVRTSKPENFKKETITDFIDKEVKGTLDIVIDYGHPERPLERQLKMSFDLALLLRNVGTPQFSANIASESDLPLQ